MLATTQRMTTTGPRSGGSRFFASPRRAPRSRNAPPEKRGAGRKTASRKFFSAPPTSRPENSTQTLGTHQRNSVWAYDFASGCAVAPNSTGATPGLGQRIIDTVAQGVGVAVLTGQIPLPIGDNNRGFLGLWFMGALPSQITYQPNSPQTSDMRQSPGAGVMRTQFTAAGGQNVRVNYGTGQAFVDTIANPFTANWSGTGMQVGGFGGATVRNNGDGTATFTITNVAGANSFFYHAIDNRTAPSGPMTNVTQTFIWTEPVPQTPPSTTGGKGPN